jgi:hypothetical protein
VKRSWPGYGERDQYAGLFDPKRSGGARGFHEGIFDQGFGGFSTLKKRAEMAKRRPEMTSRGIHGDAFTGRSVWHNFCYCYDGPTKDLFR